MAKTQLISKKLLESTRNPPFVREALAKIEAGDFVSARKILTDGLQKQPRPVEGLLALASAYWDDPDQKARDPKKSIEYLKEGISLAPKDARPYALLGRYLLSKGLRDQAMNFLDRAIQLDPDNGELRKLRDRASRQKKKQYTVVAQLKDFTAQKPKRKGGGVGKAEGFKKQATRLLKLNDIGGAAEVLEKAVVGEGHAVDAALSSLVGANIVKADRGLLTGGVRAKGVAIMKTVLAFITIAVVGIAAGAAVKYVMPTGIAAASDQVGDKLTSDRASELEILLELLIDLDDEKLADTAALAHALLLTEHGGDPLHLDDAEQALASASAEARRSPRALLARAILSKVPLADKDPELRADLDRAREDANLADDPMLLMALAEKTTGKERIQFLSAAALRKNAPSRALHLLAREHADQGEYSLAKQLLQKLWQQNPQHGPSRAVGIALALYDDDGAKEATAIERETTELLKTDIPQADAAPMAIALLANAIARQDDSASGLARQRSLEKNTAAQYPGLLSKYAELQLLEIGDAVKIRDLLEASTKEAPNIMLRVDLARARVLAGLPQNRIRQLRTGAKYSIEPGELRMALGTMKVDFRQFPVPLQAIFDSRFFPEDAIGTTLSLPALNYESAERTLAVVENLKLAEVSLGAGDVKTAQDYVDAAQKKSPGNPEVYLTRALISARSGKADDARKAIEEAQDIAPDDPRILLAAARLQLASGNIREARAALRRLDDEKFLSPTAYVVAAELALSENNIGQAEKNLAKAMEFGLDDTQVLAADIMIAGRLGDIKRGQKAAKRLRGLASDLRGVAEKSAEVRAFLASVTPGDKKTVRDALTDALRDSDKAAIAFFVLGDFEEASGQKKEAAAAFRSSKSKSKADGALFVAAETRLAALEGRPTDGKKKKRKKNRKKRRKKRRGR